MSAKAAAHEMTKVLNEEDYPKELTDFLAWLRGMDDRGVSHFARVDVEELERYLVHLGALGCPMGGRCRSAKYLKALEARHIGKEGEGTPKGKGRVLVALGKPSEQPQRRGDPPAGPPGGQKRQEAMK